MIEFNFTIFLFIMDGDKKYFKTKKQALSAIVDDHNDLVHNFMLCFNPDSIDRYKEAEHYLDQQCERLLPELDSLKKLTVSFQKLKKKSIDYLRSNECERHLLSPMRGGRITFYLGEIAAQFRRSDGWTLLSWAGQIIREQAPEEKSEVYQRYGHKTLKGLILATELFPEIKEEPTERGGIRVLYRLKHSWTFQ